MSATLPALTEREFMEQVTQLAELRGWSWAHFRPAQTAKGWRTPVSGPLGKGWPDLVLVREKDRRLIFAELKRLGASPNADQVRVLDILHSIEDWSSPEREVTIEVFTWTPTHWLDIETALR